MGKAQTDTTQKQEFEGNVGRHLTQMKELPVEDMQKTDEIHLNNVDKPLKPESVATVQIEAKHTEVKTETGEQVVVKQLKTESVGIVHEEADLNDDSYKSYTPRDFILAVVNLITLGLLIFILLKLPLRAEELKDLRNEDLKYQSSNILELPNVAESMMLAEEIKKVFLDTSGIVEFVSRVDAIKAQGGTIVKLSFANQNAVKDRTGSFGIPVIIEMRGSREDIIADLVKLQNLPFLFRPVSIEMEPNKDNPSIYDFRYGGMVYVDETKFGKN
jgi:hypothetical protein